MVITFRQVRYVLILLVIGLGYLISWRYFGEQRETNPMIGTWMMKSGVYLGPNGRPSLSPSSSKEMKVINESHFTTVWQDTIKPENGGFNGGSYTYSNQIYTEYLQYFSQLGQLGDTSYFKVDFHGNQMNISECDAAGNVSETGYFQVWERLDPTVFP